MASREATQVAYENLLRAALQGARRAAADDDIGALMAYHDILDIGKTEAADNEMVLVDPELAALDPYDLLKPDNKKLSAA